MSRPSFENDHSVFTGQEGTSRYGVTDKTAALYSSWLTASIEGELPVHEELFHLAEDPDETTYLAEDASSFERLGAMRALADRLVKEAKGGDAPPATVRLEGK